MRQELYSLETKALIDSEHCYLGLLLGWLLRRIYAVPQRREDRIKWEVFIRTLWPDLILVSQELLYYFKPCSLVRHTRDVVLVNVT